MSKPLAAYEELFEDLMEYTNYTSSEQIKTQTDLTDFFSQVKEDAKSKGHKFRSSRLLFNRFVDVLNIAEKEGKVIKRKVNEAIKSRKIFKSMKMAKASDLAVIVEDKVIYKSMVVINNHDIVKWRDAKGRFVKVPKEV